MCASYETTEETIYAAIRQLGKIFDVPSVAETLISEMKVDFGIAERTVASLDTKLTAVWLDCVGRCCKDENGEDDPNQLFIGSRRGAPNLIMKEAGLTNVFAAKEGNWACVTIDEMAAADPDVLIIVDASWDTALKKVEFLHDHEKTCSISAVQKADYITTPFSASTLGPRNGAAALDMVSAAIHVAYGDHTMRFESGVDFFEPQVLVDSTKDLKCPLAIGDIKYARTKYTNCGVTHTLARVPQRVVTMNQGSLEFMLAMGLQNHIVGTRGVPSVLDPIWPKYKDAYNLIPVMTGADGNSYPSEAEINIANADFIFADWRSAFSEYAWNNDTTRQWTSVGECGGENSDFWPAGENKTYVDKGRAPGYERKGEIESYCRPQLHADGIGTFLSAVSCEDPTLRAPPIQQTLYDTITTMGEIFDVPTVASQLIMEIKSDFEIAQRTLQESAGHALTAMIMKEAGFTNLFADRENSWACVTVADIIAAEPDVMIIVEAGFDPALDKIEFMHNHLEFCNANYVKHADYIKFPFSASTIGPRVGAAALDMVGAAIHVTTGEAMMTFNSGVEFFDPQVLVDHTKDLLCPLPADYWKAASPPPPAMPPPPPVTPPNDDSDLPAWAIAVIAVFCSLFALVLGGACYMMRREKQGKPIFTEVFSEADQKA